MFGIIIVGDRLILLKVLHEENALAAHEGRSILALLSKLAKTNQMFPQCYDLNGVHFDNIPQGGGGFADIYKGTYQDKTICLKIVRLFQQNDNSLLLKVGLKAISCHSNRFEFLEQAHVKELILWAHLRHQNILPFHGVYTVNDGRICIVSPWMNNGDLSRYLKNFPETPRNPLVRNDSFDTSPKTYNAIRFLILSPASRIYIGQISSMEISKRYVQRFR